MGKRGPKISKKSEKIVRLVKKGYSARKIAREGYSLSTAVYYHNKINHPDVFARKLDKIKALNAIRYKKLSTATDLTPQ